MDERDLVAGIGGALITITESLVRALDAKGILDQETYRATILSGIENAKQGARADDHADQQISLMILQRLADNLADPAAEANKPTPWIPGVISGGRDDPEAER